MTPFEKAVEAAKNGTLKTPNVTVNDSTIDAFYYQLTHHLHYLKMTNLGLRVKGFSVHNVKRYYGLKSKLIVDCVKELTAIKDNYAATLLNNKIETNC